MIVITVYGQGLPRRVLTQESTVGLAHTGCFFGLAAGSTLYSSVLVLLSYDAADGWMQVAIHCPAMRFGDGERGVLCIVHGRSRVTIYSRIPTMP